MYTLGHKPSEETRRKMSEKAKFRVGERNPFFGKKHTDGSKAAMSRTKYKDVHLCAKCDCIKADENTNRVKSGKQLGQFVCYCKACFSSVGLAWGRNNRGLVNERAKNKRDLFRSRLHILKSERPCYDCGGVFPPEACDFDHVSGEKKFELSKGWSFSWDEIRTEIDKCQLVCATCHRIRTESRRKAKNG